MNDDSVKPYIRLMHVDNYKRNVNFPGVGHTIGNELKRGTPVKLGFICDALDVTEYMWVTVKGKTSDGLIIGVLDNIPRIIDGFIKYEDEVIFKESRILSVLK